MARSRNKNKRIKRILLFGTLCLALDGYILYNYSNTWGQIATKRKEKDNYYVELENLKKENKDLQSTTLKLQDPEYMAKFAREKRLYSGKNEYIIKIK